MITKEQMEAIVKEVIKEARSEAEDYFDGVTVKDPKSMEYLLIGEDYCDTILHLVEKRILQKFNQ